MVRALLDSPPPIPPIADQPSSARAGPTPLVCFPTAVPNSSNPVRPATAAADQALPFNTLEDMLARINPDAPPDVRRDLESDKEDWQRAGKRLKAHVVPHGFTFCATANIHQSLRQYSINTTPSPSLTRKELLSPSITVQFIQGGTKVPTFLQDFKHWRKTANGMPSQAEMEAHTLGRIVHLQMLMHDTPWEALEKRPSVEIALRRI